MIKYRLLLLIPLAFFVSFALWTYLSDNKIFNYVNKPIALRNNEDFPNAFQYLNLKSSWHKKKGLADITFIPSGNLFSRVVYNRVGKCGSRSMQNVISELSKKNGYQFYLSEISNQTRLSPLALKEEIRLIYSVEPPMLYSRHIAYINFAKFGQVPPIYINMIRDPIERFSSQYHFKRNGDMRKPGISRSQKTLDKFTKELDINDCVLQNFTECSAEKLWYIVPYFCGQDTLCRRPSPEALMRAKRHLLDGYLMVGFVEDFEGTLKVLEKLLPMFFGGAVDIWKEISNSSLVDTSTYKKRHIRPEVKGILQKRMAYEYDFYRFALNLYKNVKGQLGIKG